MTAATCAAIPTNDRSTDTPTVEFFYDGKGLDAVQTPHNFAKGKLTKVSNTVSQTLYRKFDNLGRLEETEQTTPIDETIANARSNGRTYVSKYKYNLSGALTEEEYPSGRVVKNAFESDGDLMRIFGNATPSSTERTYATSFSYTPDGRISRLKLGNGLWEAAKFNSRLQVTELAVGHGVASGDVWKLGYEYGEIGGSGNVDTAKNTGNVARQTLSFNGLANPFVTSYKYDSLFRLTEAKETSNSNQTWRQVFDYDRYGNRLTHNKFNGTEAVTQTTVEHPSIDPLTNRINSSGYVFDKNGNLTTDGENRHFAFNADNKQREVRDSGNNLVGEYFYDGEGKRVKKVTYGPTTETTLFVYSSGKLVAEYSTEQPPAQPTTNFTVTDLLGSPRVLLNSLGEVISRRDFLPFGEEIAPDQSVNYRTTAQKYLTNEDGVRQKFTGYQKDKETGLDFAEARMYENRHARFTAVDPLLASGKSANPQTFNRYTYVANSPLVFTDPTGLQIATAPEEPGIITVCCAIAYPMRWVSQIISYGGQSTRSGSSQPNFSSSYEWQNDPKLAGVRNSARDAENARAMNEFVGAFPVGAADRAKSYLDLPNYDLVPRVPIPPFTATMGLPKVSLTDFGFKPWFNYASPPQGANETFGRTAGGMAVDIGAAYVTGRVAGSFASAQRATSVENFILTESPLVSARSASSTIPTNTGSYLLRFESGNFYAGKGTEARMNRSASSLSRLHNDPVVSRQFFPAPNNRAAFMNEHSIMMQNGGPLSANPFSPTYNQIRSPGCQFFCQ